MATNNALNNNLASGTGLPLTTGVTGTLPVANGGTGVITSTGTGSVVLNTSPTLTGIISDKITWSDTTKGIVGTTTNDDAGAGYVGEFVSANRAYASPLALTNNTITNLTSISLSAGDWDVYGNVINNNSNDYIQFLYAWTNTVSVTLPSEVNNVGLTLFGSAGGNVVRSTQFSTIAPYQRYSLSTTTTIYLIANTASNAGTNNCSGSIYARRVR